MAQRKRFLIAAFALALAAATCGCNDSRQASLALDLKPLHRVEMVPQLAAGSYAAEMARAGHRHVRGGERHAGHGAI